MSLFASDITHAVIAETTYGVLPTSGNLYQLALSADQAPLQATATEIKDDNLYPNRAGGGSQRGTVSVSGTVNQRAIYAPVTDLLLQSALCNAFNSGVLTAGVTEQSYSLISSFGSLGKQITSGIVNKGFTLDAKADDKVTLDWQVMGTVYSANATNALTVTAQPVAHLFQGSDIANVVVAGATLAYDEISFQTTLDRTSRAALGSNTGLQPGVNGARTTEVTIKAYRDSLTVDALLTGLPQAFAFDLGTTGAGYHFNVPSMIFQIPTTELNNGSAYVTIKGSAKYDATLTTDFSITKL